MERCIKYQAVVRSRYGVLLGGVKSHASIWYTSERDAMAFGKVVYEANLKAGRFPYEPYVKKRGCIPCA
jgi:hypothetical protein